jgi:hypothetical protein
MILASLWSFIVLWNSPVSAQSDLSQWLPDSSVMLWKIRPPKICESTCGQLFPWEAFGAVSNDELGIDLVRQPEIFGSIELSEKRSIDSALCFEPVRSIDLAVLNSQIFGPMRRSAAEPAVSLRRWKGTDWSVVQKGSLWLGGTETSLKRMLKKSRTSHRLSEVLRRQEGGVAFVIDIKQIKSRLADYLKFFELSPLSEAAVLGKRICDLADYVTCRFDLYVEASVEIRWVSVEHEKADELKAAVEKFLEFGGKSIVEEAGDLFRWGRVEGVSPENWLAYWRRVFGRLDGVMLQEIEEGVVVTRMYHLEELVMILGLAVMSSNPMEEIQAILPRPVTEANLETLAIAVHSYEAVHRRVPTRVVRDKNDKPLLSWRVLLLPYIGEEQLYSQFRLDEAWDSEHNLKLLDKMPKVFANPNADLQVGYTSYLAPYGYTERREQTAWDVEPLLLRQVGDGLANTAAIVEVEPSSAVPWTKPEDFDLRERSLVEFLGEPPAGGWVVMLDTTCYDLSRWQDNRKLKAVLTVNGGEAVTAPF